jgi:putative transposase
MIKSQKPGIGLVKLCWLFGITRQAYYQHFWQQEAVSIEQEMVLKEVVRIRENHRHMGGRKLYEQIAPFMLEHQIKLGRDALFDLLSANHLLVRRRKRRIVTTQSFHWLRKYPNLIKDYIPTVPNQLWVSDITYWKIKQGHVYISFITDAYSHKIVGYHVAESLESIESLQALKMALTGLICEPESHFQLVHHSDRGIQYCSSEYVKLLKQNNILISMTEKGDPLENAIAERINGIIKEEYLHDYTVNNLNEAKELLLKVVKLYNDDRPHMSIGNLVPSIVHDLKLKSEKLWKNYSMKKTKLVNILQDENSTVNLSQD